VKRRTAKPALSHFDASGAAHMVNVAAKPESLRTAIATGEIAVAPATARTIRAGKIGKGDVLGIARTAAIQAAKRTAELIPLCHPLRLTAIDVALEVTDSAVAITATVQAFDRTGVEMEALTAVSAAALTVYDMCKAIDKAMVIGPIKLASKTKGTG